MNKTYFLETWEIHNRINLYLLKSLKEEHLLDRSVSKGRNVGEQFAHINNVRLMWLQASNAELLKGQVKIDKDKPVSKSLLSVELEKSGKAILSLLESAFEQEKIKGFKPHPAAFLGYLISHESHHRGQIILLLKESGHIPDKKILFGLWEWGSR
jgi:uncharacterized damage-inducible protein DinB